ncbi:MAG: epoxyqueuosine reductase [Chloroflexota bacterium]
MQEQLPTNPARFIEEKVKEFVHTNPVNFLPFMDNYPLWSEPLVKFADGDDPIFTEYKKIIGAVHLTPREALAQAYNKKPEDMPAHLTVISWILPIAEQTRLSNRKETKIPSRLWSHTRWYGEKANVKLMNYVVELLTSMGYLAAAPSLQPYHKRLSNEKGPYSNWSERHVAYAAGQGTFSLSDGLITERGIAHRCGSVITDLVIPASPRSAKSPYSNCIFYLGVDCRACIERCPAEAISEKGHDKNKCQQYLRDIIGYSAANREYNNDTTNAGCGLCQVKVPCEFENPAKKIK